MSLYSLPHNDWLVLKAYTKIFQKWCSFGTIDILLDQNDCCYVIFLKNVQRVPSNRFLVKEAKTRKSQKRQNLLFTPYVNLNYPSPMAVILAGTVPLT